MSKKLMVTEIDKEERIRKHELKRKSKQREKIREEGFERKIKSKKNNKNWLRAYELYEDSDDFDIYEDEF